MNLYDQKMTGELAPMSPKERNFTKADSSIKRTRAVMFKECENQV